jgi:hypothetical protein
MKQRCTEKHQPEQSGMFCRQGYSFSVHIRYSEMYSEMMLVRLIKKFPGVSA